MAVTLYRVKWFQGKATPTCACGWYGNQCSSDREAKEQHKSHMREDCPIGAR
jgi:hypothetical protein